MQNSTPSAFTWGIRLHENSKMLINKMYWIRVDDAIEIGLFKECFIYDKVFCASASTSTCTKSEKKIDYKK